LTCQNSPILEVLYNDIIKHGGVHAIGTKQVGKSNLKKTLTDFVIRNHPETKSIIIDPEGSWEYDFSKIRLYRIPKKSMKITEEPIGRRLNGQIFTRKIYKLDRTTKQDVLKLLKDDKPVLFIVELDNPEEIGYFSAFVIETIYDMQRIKRKYWKGNLKTSYFIVLEEAENIFDQSSLDKTIFNKLRKKYAEMANLKIGIMSSSQRLTEVSKKFRAKMAGYLIGHILEDDFIGLIQRMLKLKLGKKAQIVTEPSFRHSFFYTTTKQIIKLPQFKQSGKPYLIQRGFSLPKPKPQAEDQEPTFGPKKKPSKWKRFIDWLIFPLSITKNPNTRNETRNEKDEENEDESEELNAIMAETDKEDEEYFW